MRATGVKGFLRRVSMMRAAAPSRPSTDRHIADRPHHGVRNLRQGRLEGVTQIAIEAPVVGIVDGPEDGMRAEPMVMHVDQTIVMRLREADHQAAQYIRMKPHIAGSLTGKAIGLEPDQRCVRRHEDAECRAIRVDRREDVAQRFDPLIRREVIGPKRFPDRSAMRNSMASFIGRPLSVRC